MSDSRQSATPFINLRSKYLWLSLLLVFYSIFGVVIVPKIVDSQVKNNLKTLANWDTQIQQTRFNPFALSLEITGSKITDTNNKEIISFDRLFIDFNLIETFSGKLAFDEVSLDKPFVFLDIDKQGKTNFQKAFISEEQTAEEPASPEDNQIIGLLFDLIAINEGRLDLSDHSQGDAFKLTFEPLSLALEGFSTQHNNGGDYVLSLALGDKQEINWQGQIGVAPFQSEGHLELKNIRPETFWHYVKDLSPYWLNQASITISGDYTAQHLNNETSLLIENSELIVQDLSLSETAESESIFSLRELKIAPISFDLNQSFLDLGHIELSSPSINIERAENASLNILRPLVRLEKEETTTTEKTEPTITDEMPANNTQTDKGFSWQISDIHIGDGEFKWQDNVPSKATALSLNDIDLSLGALSADLSQPIPYELVFAWNNNHDSITHSKKPIKQRLTGDVSLDPFKIKGTAEIQQLDLTPLQNYIGESANLYLKHGSLNLNANYDLAMNESLSGKIQATSQIDELHLSDSVLNLPLSGFKQLNVGPVIVTLPAEKEAAPSVEIETITFIEPYGDILLSEDGQLNLTQIAKETRNKDSENVQNLTESSNSNAPSKQEINEQETTTLAEPHLVLNRFAINKGAFTFTDASIKPAFVTKITQFNGAVDGLSSDVNAKSSVAFSGLVDEDGQLELKGSLNPLSDSPNSDIRVKVKNVNMSMASPYAAKYAGYQIDKGKLELDLSYLINGKKLKANNKILLNQFEFGDSVDSPDATNLPLPLAIGILKDRKGLIDIELPVSGNLNDPSFKLSSVIFNTFVNLITKAVTSPFSMLGSLIEGDDDISDVDFVAGSSELTDEQKQRILTLAEALKQRPNLTLEIRGIADANKDQLNNLPFSEAELIKLAKARASMISTVMTAEGNIDSGRIYILEPELIALKKKPTDTQAPALNNSQASSPTQDLPLVTVSSKFTLGVR